MPLVFRYAARSDVGLVRSGNEDSGYASDTLLIVADGMGGHVAGEMASATVTAIIAGLPIADSEDVLTQLADAVDEAQLEMRHIIAERPDFQGMGTTVTAVCWQGDRASIAHVGDSRAYMLREGQLLRLTKDHTYVQTLVDAGQITADEAATHRRRNLLIRAIDGVNTVEPDLSIREVHPGDRIMLCTDGLSGVMRDSEIHELLARSDPPGAVTALVDAATMSPAWWPTSLRWPKPRLLPGPWWSARQPNPAPAHNCPGSTSRRTVTWNPARQHPPSRFPSLSPPAVAGAAGRPSSPRWSCSR